MCVYVKTFIFMCNSKLSKSNPRGVAMCPYTRLDPWKTFEESRCALNQMTLKGSHMSCSAHGGPFPVLHLPFRAVSCSRAFIMPLGLGHRKSGCQPSWNQGKRESRRGDGKVRDKCPWERMMCAWFLHGKVCSPRSIVGVASCCMH